MSELKITVRKATRTLEVYCGRELKATMPIALGGEPIGPKACQGDCRTPEGTYHVCSRNEKSKYHLALGLSYPNAQDANRGYAGGLIDGAQAESIRQACRQGKRPPWNTGLGGEIMIHGGGAGADWTVGCIALEDERMDELWKIIEIGTIVEIMP